MALVKVLERKCNLARWNRHHLYLNINLVYFVWTFRSSHFAYSGALLYMSYSALDLREKAFILGYEAERNKDTIIKQHRTLILLANGRIPITIIAS